MLAQLIRGEMPAENGGISFTKGSAVDHEKQQQIIFTFMNALHYIGSTDLTGSMTIEQVIEQVCDALELRFNSLYGKRWFCFTDKHPKGAQVDVDRITKENDNYAEFVAGESIFVLYRVQKWN